MTTTPPLPGVRFPKREPPKAVPQAAVCTSFVILKSVDVLMTLNLLRLLNLPVCQQARVCVCVCVSILRVGMVAVCGRCNSKRLIAEDAIQGVVGGAYARICTVKSR